MKKKITINLNELKIAILLLFSIQIESLSFIMPSISMPFNFYLPIIACAIMVALNLKRKRISTMALWVVGYFVWIFAVTFVKHPGNIQLLLLQMASPLAVALLTEYYMSRCPNTFLRATGRFLVFLIVIDLITIILKPGGLYSNGIYTDCWFLGYKTARLRLATLPVVMIYAIMSIRKSNRLDKKFWIISVLALCDTLLSKNTGGVVTIAAMLIGLYFMYRSNVEKNRLFAIRFFSSKWLIVIILALTVTVNVAQNLFFLEPFMKFLEQKDITIMARTRIWTASLEYFERSPLIGNGYLSSTEFSSAVGFAHATQPHSLLMSVLVYSGLVGVVVYIIMIYRSFSCVNSRVENSTSVICAIYILCMMIHGIISIHLFSAFMYAAMIMAYYLGNMDSSDQSDNKLHPAAVKAGTFLR